MSTDDVMLIGIIAIFVAVIGIIVVSDIRYPRDDLPIANDRSINQQPKSSVPQCQWPAHSPPTAPPRPPTVDEAHAIMQKHIECLAAECPRKHAAHHVLVKTGQLIPRGHR